MSHIYHVVLRETFKWCIDFITQIHCQIKSIRFKSSDHILHDPNEALVYPVRIEMSPDICNPNLRLAVT